MWPWQEIIFKSKFNGEIKLRQFFGRPSVWAGGFEQSGNAHVGPLWKKALAKVSFVPKNVLILGLGGGTAAKIISQKWPAAKITGVEIDPVMIFLGKKYFNLAKIPNLEIIQSDATNFLRSTKQKFDLILTDAYIGNRRETIKIPKKLLTKNGLIITNHLEGLKSSISYQPEASQGAHKQ
ncbi:MAG: methyltransferase domain-containing protein [Patescibacteria group bacterium]|nr:methyltransferase domain-containing protein [Patescibacteria group bacterium]MCL5431513.1 methyltransferase domain-containing protein [Patescibacteria group bacterium]